MSERGVIRKLLHDIKPARRQLALGMLLYVPVTVLSVIQPAIIGYAVQHGMLTGGAKLLIWFFAVFMLAVVALAACELWQGLMLQIAGQIFVTNLRKDAFAKAQRLSMGFLDNVPLGRLLTRLTNDTEAVGEMFSMGAVQI